jgi:release factor glutamine methyltransferase
MSLKSQLTAIVSRLERAGVPSGRVDAELLVAHVLQISRGDMLASCAMDRDLTSFQEAELELLVKRREQREPLQHLLGVAPFMTFDVQVGPGVFVPRPETESLAERAIQSATAIPAGDRGVHIIDLCSGSGVVAIALARAIPHASVYALEVSEEALPYLRHNAATLAPELIILEGSVETWGAGVSPGSFDLIVSNPPYIPDAEVPNDPEVQNFDPQRALYGGPDGLDVVRQIVAAARVALRGGGALMVEHSNLQGAATREIFTQQDFRTITTEQDMVGRDRFTQGYRV